MDVQGYELEVLKGFGNYIKSVEYIFTEVNRDYLYEENVLINELDEFLKKMDLFVFGPLGELLICLGEMLFTKANSIWTATRILISFKTSFLLVKYSFQFIF